MNKPPFCPNDACPLHHEVPSSRTWFVRDGHYQSALHGSIQRFRCRECGIHFSSQTFNIDYGVKRHLSYHKLFELLITSSGIRDMGRSCRASPHCVSNRISRLARQALALHADLLDLLHLTEDLVADGFESFAVSQYFPNNIQILAGKESQFWIYSDYAHLRRKGRMTDYQKKRNAILQRQFTHGRVTVYESFEELIRVIFILLEQADRSGIQLFTDCHQSYIRVLKNLTAAERSRLIHRLCSSRLPRTVSNELFSVNYLDREIRKDLAEHTRETVQFGRNAVNQMERLAIYRAYHNYFKAFRIGSGEEKEVTHAEKAGIPSEAIRREVKTFFTQRRFLSRIRGSMNRDLNVWLRAVTTPLKQHAEHLPAYALA